MSIDPPRRLRTIFAGTPSFAVPSLQRLAAHDAVELISVYTQPDRKAGRGRRNRTSAVKDAALELAVPVNQPEDFKSNEAIATFSAHTADLLVVAAYGLLLPQAVIDAVGLALNVHASLLPRGRGAAPIQRAIIAGDENSGISMMRIVAALDAGPVLLQRVCPIETDDTGGTLHDKLALLGADCLDATVKQIVQGSSREQAQDESLVNYAAKISSADRALDWQLNAHDLERRVRALNPSPVAQMMLGDMQVKVWQATAIDEAHDSSPGSLVRFTKNTIDIACQSGILRIIELQIQGKRPMAASAFVNGFRRHLEQLLA